IRPTAGTRSGAWTTGNVTMVNGGSGVVVEWHNRRQNAHRVVVGRVTIHGWKSLQTHFRFISSWSLVSLSAEEEKRQSTFSNESSEKQSSIMNEPQAKKSFPKLAVRTV